MRSTKMRSMRLNAIAGASVAIIGWASAAGAGVVIQAQELSTRSGGPSPSSGAVAKPYTEMIEGKQAKLAVGSLQVIVDLASDKALVLNARKGAYFELPIPPPPGSVFGQLIMRRILPPLVKYNKTGKHLTLAGHSCDQYTGAGEVNGAAVTVEACYSTDAPGAQDYTAFVKSVAKTANPSGATTNEIPPGIPLELDATIIPKQPPENPAASKQQPATPGQPTTPQQPVVIKLKTTVKSVASQSIAAAEFQTGTLKLEKPPKYLGLYSPPKPFAIKPPQKPPVKQPQ